MQRHDTLVTTPSAGYSTPPVISDIWQSPHNQSLSVYLSAGAVMTYTVEHTCDNPNRAYATSFAVDATWLPTLGLAGLSASADGNIAFPVSAVRLKIITYTSGTVRLISISGGA